MSPRLIIFIVIFIYLAMGGLSNPVLGILGYIIHYILGAENTWWHSPISPLGIRYSFTFAIIIMIGIYRNINRLQYGRFLTRQEILGLLMLGLMWVLYFVGPETINRYVLTDHATVKMTKVMIFCLMMTHVVTQTKDLDKIFWVFVICGGILGFDAYDLPRSAFIKGRLDGRIGGSDFLDANSLAAFMVVCTLISGIMFIRSSWKGRLLCTISGVFSINTVVLCRSRGAVLALMGAAMMILLTAPRRAKPILIGGMLIAFIGLIYLSDEGFLNRMGKITKHADSVLAGEEASDRSSMMRIEAWMGGLQMAKDFPMGVGPGNFNQFIYRYAPDIPGLSPHSLYIQCLAELGYEGLLLLFGLLGNALLMCFNIIKKSAFLGEPQRTSIKWSASCVSGIIFAYITFGLTGHITYKEIFWWFLMMPACLQRAMENAYLDLQTQNA